MAAASVLGAPVFSAAGRTYRWEDVVEAARSWGDWGELERATRRALAAEQGAARAGALPSPAQVRDAANAFRYERKLLAADELDEWLARWQLSLDDWFAYVRRSLIAIETDGEDAGVVADDEVALATWAHAVCSGVAVSLALRLASQVAVHARLSGADVAAEASLEDALGGMDAEVERYLEQIVTDAAITAEIGDNYVGWTRLHCRCLSHAREEVVREAALCVREDGRELAAVAADAGVSVEEAQLLLDDVEPALRVSLLGAQPGDLLGPLSAGDAYLLVQVIDRVAPVTEDSWLRERARERLRRRALDTEVSTRVRWHERL